MSDTAAPQAERERRPVWSVLRLSWPAATSYLLNNTYRINDQFWVQDLGASAQAAMGATLFVLIAQFALIYLACGGALSLVAQAKGAGEPGEMDRVSRHSLLLGLLLSGGLAASGPFVTGPIVELLGLRAEAADFAVLYLGGIFQMVPFLTLAAVVDHLLIGRGNSLAPMLLQALAVVVNFALNPLLIYGTQAAQVVEDVPALAPLGRAASACAESFGIEGRGLYGAALATGLSRLASSALGLFVLWRLFGLRLWGRGRPRLPLLGRIVSISAPVSLSIATYGGVYWAILALVLARLEPEVTAGLGLGFQIFEGVVFPTYLGVSMAGATLVGQRVGARDPEGARQILHAARGVARCLGALATLAFLFGAAGLARHFTSDEAVLAETVHYVHLLAWSQYFVALQVVDEKALLGAAHSRPIVWITTSGDLLRVPLSYLLALSLGWGASGVWWAINLTTYYKAGLLRLEVSRGRWLQQALRPEPVAEPSAHEHTERP